MTEGHEHGSTSGWWRRKGDPQQRREMRSGRAPDPMAREIEAVLARVGDAVVVSDATGTITQFNEAAEILTGIARDHALGRSCREILGLQSGEAPFRCCDADGAEALTGDAEVWRQAAEGRRQPLLAAVAAVRDSEGEVKQVVHSLRDISSIKQSDEAKSQFLATASHELKTPVAVIQGFARALLDDQAGTPEEKRRALEAVKTRASELSDIVERILLSSRIDTGQVRVAPVELDLEPLLRAHAEELSQTARREVVVEVQPGLPAAFADERAVSTMVDHLIDNAIKYSPDGGRVVVRATADASWVHLSVSDSGIGMSRQQAERCFDKFWQADSSEARRISGTGIGLYIVKSLIDSTGGRISVDSRVGEGTSFHIALPLFGADVVDADSGPRELGPGVGDPSIVREFMRQLGVRPRRIQ